MANRISVILFRWFVGRWFNKTRSENMDPTSSYYPTTTVLQKQYQTFNASFLSFTIVCQINLIQCGALKRPILKIDFLDSSLR